MLHSLYDETNGIHIPFGLGPYANASARTGATGLVITDNGKFAKQTDTTPPTVWMLYDYTGPYWIRVITGRTIGVPIAGALTTSSGIADFTIPEAMNLGNIIFDVGTAVATANMTIDVTYGTNPAVKTTLFSVTKPKIVNGSYTSTDGVLTTKALAARGHLTVTLSGTFTAATDLTMWLIPK